MTPDKALLGVAACCLALAFLILPLERLQKPPSWVWRPQERLEHFAFCALWTGFGLIGLLTWWALIYV